MSIFAITPSPIPDVKIIQPRTYEDDRGFFLESYSHTALLQGGIDIAFVQDNHSLSTKTGTLRGLHFQRAPFAQDKLVRVVRGRIWDVAVDMRRGSSTFGKWFGLELSATNRTQLLVPIGFAHGFLTLEPDTEVLYKASAPYNAHHDCGVAWNDEELAVQWPLSITTPILSDKDQNLPRLADAATFD